MPDSTVALPLRAYGPPVDPPQLQPLQYWPFSSADLYNWKNNHPSFSEEERREREKREAEEQREGERKETEERENRRERRQDKTLARILAVVAGDRKEVSVRPRQTGYLGNQKMRTSNGGQRYHLEKDQCACCKKKGH